MDIRTAKELFIFGLSLCLVLFAISQGFIRRFSNMWLLLFVAFCYVSILFASGCNDFIMAYVKPENNRIALEILKDRNVSNLWMYKSFSYVFLYTLLLISIASFDFEYNGMKKIVKVMVGCGIVMALYIIVQKFALDQFFNKSDINKNPDVNNVTQWALGGFIGQPTVVAPFIAMLVPLTIYLRKYICATLMAISVFMTESKMAGGALLVGLVFLFIFYGREYYKTFGIILLCGILMAGSFWLKEFSKVENKGSYFSHISSGRTAIWAEMWKSFVTPVNGKKYTITGQGPGSFFYLFPIRHNNTWKQAHNEPLEIIMNFGIVGFAFLCLAFRRMFINLDFVFGDYELIFPLLTSLLIIFLCSLGTFTFHIAPVYFYTLIILGFLHNRSLLKGV